MTQDAGREPEQQRLRLEAEQQRLRLEAEQQRLQLEKKRERYVWYYLAYFLFGIHIVAFVMIYAVLHAK
ncbi:hypothetical protein [Streptomyces guryensis]|uniref:Uncharacterized protein n=1 Tax=Streptomyces guryensis TaxID=2886947 RepID=A0A9Q3VQM4_9ACTN|nr:hypothetical protein [Streptomyces guryensis]MCD9876047.1 hypothetical protein [Streptomyces guryensis]